MWLAQASLLYQPHQSVARTTLPGGSAPRFDCEPHGLAQAHRLSSASGGAPCSCMPCPIRPLHLPSPWIGELQLYRNRGSPCPSHASTLSLGVCCESSSFCSHSDFDVSLTLCACAWPKWSYHSTEASSSQRSRTWRTGQPWCLPDSRRSAPMQILTLWLLFRSKLNLRGCRWLIWKTSSRSAGRHSCRSLRRRHTHAQKARYQTDHSAWSLKSLSDGLL